MLLKPVSQPQPFKQKVKTLQIENKQLQTQIQTLLKQNFLLAQNKEINYPTKQLPRNQNRFRQPRSGFKPNPAAENY